MLSKVYTVYDSKTEAYMQPFFMAAKGAAIRAFSDLVNDPQHTFGKHPGDYVLFEIGTYEDVSALLVAYPAPQSLGVGLEFVKSS